MLVVADTADDQLNSLLADLPGLLLVSDVRVTDTDAIRALMHRHKLVSDFLLYFERDALMLCRQDEKGRFGKQKTALNASELVRRAADTTELQRACFAGKASATVQVLDLFAGWGMDACMLAAAGAGVTCVELQPAMVALLRDVTRRVEARVAQRLTVVHGDALSYLDALRPGQADVIYLDPMFPSRNKTALPNKRLQWLAQLTSSDTVALDALIDKARVKTRDKVVLKRRRKDPVIGTPARQISGSSVRYDVYC